MKVWVVAQKGFDNALVFFGFKGAGTVHEDAARGYELGSVGEEGALQACEVRDIRCPAVPAQVRMVAEDAQSRTGCIYEHAVKQAVEGQMPRIGCDGMNAGDAEPMHVLLQDVEPGPKAVRGEDKTAICHAFGNAHCFAARRAAQIENGLSGLRVKQGNDLCRARALHAEQAIAIRTGLKEMARMGYREEMGAGNLRVNPFSGEVVAQRIERCPQHIGADGDGGLGIVAFAQGVRFIQPVAFDPACDEPLRMGCGEGEVLDGVDLGIGKDNGVAVFSHAAQDRIDQLGDVCAEEVTGEGDGFRNDRIRRHAVEVLELVRAQAQEIA